jgi:hypothetical protein
MRLAVDTEFGPHHRLYALSQGVWDLPAIPDNEGRPASPDTGTLMRDGSVTAVAGRFDRPTSLEIVGDTAYVITLTARSSRSTACRNEQPAIGEVRRHAVRARP